MDFDLTPDQQTLQRAARALADRFDDRYWAGCDASGAFPQEFFDAFASAGWLGIAVPVQWGGGGLGILEASILLEEIAMSGAAMNGCSTIHLTIFIANILAKHASADIRDTVLPSVAAGTLRMCFAVTEPDAGTDTTRISTRAVREGAGYTISGRKIWISNARHSDKMLILVRTTPRELADRPTDGMSLFLIDIPDPHVQIRPIEKMGRNAVESCEVLISDLRVSESCLVGVEGKGFRHLLDGINPERIMLAHEAVGIGRAALRKAVSYTRSRTVFARPIGANQGISFPLAIAHSRLAAAKAIAQQAAWLYDQGKPCGSEANMAKWLCAEAGFMAADSAVQVHGGMGYAREFSVERYFREARLMRLAPISQEMALNYVATHTLGLPKSY
jgi:acyl-CoA dehydrogenase